jgi:hypothetical protein
MERKIKRDFEGEIFPFFCPVLSKSKKKRIWKEFLEMEKSFWKEEL